jgi:hypothetical protein
LQFDNQPVCTVAAGWKIPLTWTQLTFLNPNSYAITLTYFYGSNSVSFSGLIQSQNLKTYTLGCFGLKASGNYNGQAVTIAGGSIVLGVGATLKISGVNNGNTRKTIIFNVQLPNNGTGSLNVQDANGCNLFDVLYSQIIALDTGSDFIIVGSGAAVTFDIAEIYYQS